MSGPQFSRPHAGALFTEVKCLDYSIAIEKAKGMWDLQMSTPGHCILNELVQAHIYRYCKSDPVCFSDTWIGSAVSWSRLSYTTASRTGREGGTIPERPSSSRLWSGSGSSMKATALVCMLRFTLPLQSSI